MSQKTLPFKFGEDKKQRRITSLGGLALYTGLAHIMDLSKSVRSHIRGRKERQGWTDSQVIMSLIPRLQQLFVIWRLFIINHSWELIIQLPKKHPSFGLLKTARARIAKMGGVPAG